jgi:hypothetical protein
MAEHSLIGYVMKGMRPHWEKAVKHADGFTSGIADISAWIVPAGNIWLELKARASWPKGRGTVVWFDFDDLQKDFIRCRRGWVLCRVRREYFLFDHVQAQLLDTPHATMDGITNAAKARWINSINWQEFAECVRRSYV